MSETITAPAPRLEKTTAPDELRAAFRDGLSLEDAEAHHAAVVSLAQGIEEALDSVREAVAGGELADARHHALTLVGCIARMQTITA